MEEIVEFNKPVRTLFSAEIINILKEQLESSITNIGPETGEQSHPFDFFGAIKLKKMNSYHSACIDTKVSCVTGLGFTTEKEYEILDPLTTHGFHVEQQKATQDFAETGNWFMEVVREEPRQNSPIVAINHIPATNAFVEIVADRNIQGKFHIEYKIQYQNALNPNATFPRFGDLDSFMERTDAEGESISEILHIIDPSNSSMHYGVPGWLAAVYPIELSHCNFNYLYDFFLNRGVPEFMLFLKGEVDEKTFEKIEEAIKAHIGLTNSHKSLLAKMDLNVEVQLEKLGIDQKGEKTFSDLEDTLALNIVSAHRVPPLLAGIQVPGKMGAANELPNGIMGYQLLEIGPDQVIISNQLRNSLGNPQVNGGLPLTKSDFTYKKITEEFDMFGLDTMSRMRQTVPEARAEGRNLQDGLRD